MTSTADHLIVLCHGLGGNHQELAYLERKLSEKSKSRDLILNSKRNAEDLATLGILKCAEELAEEITEEVAKYPNLKRISLVGMSLGGLMQRAAAKLLYDPERKTIAGLIPETFMGIASPFVGVKNNTFLPIPKFIQKMMAWQFGQSGTELFFFDSENPLIMQMCLNEEYLTPLASFKRRILYAALVGDFMVLLETGAILESDEVSELRSAYAQESGIVATIDRTLENVGRVVEEEKQGAEKKLSVDPDNPPFSQMKKALNSLGWLKIIVNFRFLLPMAHLAIVANERWSEGFRALMGLDDGQCVMDDAAERLNLIEETPVCSFLFGALEPAVVDVSKHKPR